MTNRTLNGWLIHYKPSGEASLFLSLLTEEQGLIKVSYPGGQSRKRKANLPLFTPLWIDLAERNNRSYCQSIEPKNVAPNLTGPTLYCAYYVNELIYKTLKQPEIDVTLYQAYEQTITTLKQPEPASIERSLRQFEWALLICQGHSYSFEFEGDQQTTIQATSDYQFQPGYGFYSHEHGIKGQQILTIAQKGLRDKASLKVAKIIMRQAIDYLVDYQPIHARKMMMDAMSLTTKAKV